VLLANDAKFDTGVVTFPEISHLRGSVVSLASGHLIEFLKVAGVAGLFAGMGYRPRGGH
jgi:hypothetical protein